MVKTVLGVNHQGLRDWLWQRVSAIVMTLYVLGIMAFLIGHPHTEYYEWHALFSHLWMKSLTALVVFTLLYHAWVGMWTVYTDYVKIAWLNITLQVMTALVLIAMFLETLQILWGV